MINCPIPGFQLSRTRVAADTTVYEGELEKVKMPCPKCAGEAYGNGKGEMLVRDVSVGDTMIGWLVHPQKYLCKSQTCGQTWIQPILGVDRGHKMTHRLVDFIVNHAAEETASSIANDIGIDPKTVADIFAETADAALESRTIDTPRVMGIDEVRLGRKVRAVIVNIESKTIVEMLPDRKKETVLEFFKGLPNKEKVEVVAMDAWNTYREVVKDTISGARIVLDKFHVHMMATNAMEQARKHVRNRLTKKEAEGMKKDRSLLLSSPENLKSGQKLQLNAMLARYPVLSDCRSKYCEFREIWKAHDPEQAKERIDNWRRGLREQDDLPGAVPTQSPAAEFFDDVEKTFNEWEDEILAYFRDRTTNAFTESMNKAIRKLFELGNGYTFESLRRKILLSKSGIKKKTRKLRVPAFAPLVMGFYSGQGNAVGYEEVIVEENLGIDPVAAAKALSEAWCIGVPRE